MNKFTFFSTLLFLCLALTIFAQVTDSSVFKTSSGGNPSWILYRNNNLQLYKTITSEAFKLLEERSEKVSKLETREDWQAYRKELFPRFFEGVSKFKKTPLNAKITGTIKKKNYKIEKIIFESHPNFFVTGCLYIPKKHEKPAATVIYVSGHSSLGFRSPTYQNIILNLVNKGFIVFAFDPIGQGERLQYVNRETNKSDIGGPTTEHSYAGVQTLLTGTSLTSYFIWDGVRAIDYLATRNEVDLRRLGITGRSGGGTQTDLIAAYDSRIYAAAPECYTTNFKRLLQSIGPQDAEQNPYNAIKKGFDFPDYFHFRAPKPTLIITTTHDFFSQQGARETFAEAQKSYAAFGYPENIQKVEDFGVHESTKKNREAMYAFFQKYLNNPGDNSDSAMSVFPEEELWVTKTGQVGTSLKSETVFSLNEKYFSKKEVPRDALQQTIKTISGINLNYKLTAGVFTGKIPGDKFTIEKYFLENNKDEFALPVWVIKANNTKATKILVWLSPEGKTELLKNPVFNQLIDKGFTIISADLPETGELKNDNFKGDGFVKSVPFNYTFGANLIGKSIPAIRAEALDLLMQFVEKQNSKHVKVDALIEKEMNSAFLHFTAFKNPFSKVVLLSPLSSNETLIHKKMYNPKLAFSVVPGSVGYYDFKDLVSLLPQKMVKIVNPLTGEESTKPTETDESSIIDFLNN